MTLKEIQKQLPTSGETCGTYIPQDSVENWLDHALEKLVCQHAVRNDLFAAGMAMAVQVMTAALTIEGVDWSIINSVLKALDGYLE